MNAQISEIFSSIQGEGLRIGERHLFVRFYDCNLHCVGCDERTKTSQILTMTDVLSEVYAIEGQQGPHQYVVLTGGEPLYYASFVNNLSRQLKENGFRILLETNGTLFDEYKRIKQDINLTAMDIKLQSVWHINDCYSEHKKFMECMVDCEAYLKIVISTEVDVPEFMRYIELIKLIQPTFPVILQPFEQVYGLNNSDILDCLLHLQSLALQKLPQVRVLPRLHTVLHVR